MLSYNSITIINFGKPYEMRGNSILKLLIPAIILCSCNNNYNTVTNYGSKTEFTIQEQVQAADEFFAGVIVVK